MSKRKSQWFRLIVVLSLLAGVAGVSPTAFADADPRIQTAPTCPTDASIDLELYVVPHDDDYEDADNPPGPELLISENVTFSYEVVNTGLMPLYGVIVGDDQLGIVCKKASLAPGERMYCDVVTPVQEGQQVHRAKAGAACINEAGQKQSVKDIDFAYYLGVDPIVRVCLRANSGDLVWNLKWNMITGDLWGEFRGWFYGCGPYGDSFCAQVGPWSASGYVSPSDALFSPDAYTRVRLRADSSIPLDCAVYRYESIDLQGRGDYEGEFSGYYFGSLGYGDCWEGELDEMSWSGKFTSGPCP